MRPGALAAEVDAILRDGVLSAGLRDSYDNITGYTLGFYAAGRAAHERLHPHLPPRRRLAAEARAWCSTCTPPPPGASFSETVLVTERGPERLTKLPRT